MAYKSEADKVRTLPHVMQYVQGSILDIGCGDDKITPDAIGVDGRDLPGVDVISKHAGDFAIQGDLMLKFGEDVPYFDTVFSSHFLEHIPDQYQAIEVWRTLIADGGHLVLYLPDGNHYNNKENQEHVIDMKYEDFLFWFRRSFCGEGKDFRDEHLPKYFNLVDHGLDVGHDRYSFYIVAQKV